MIKIYISKGVNVTINQPRKALKKWYVEICFPWGKIYIEDLMREIF